MALFPAFGLCYMMTITFQTIGDAKYGLFLSLIRQGLFYVPFILLLPRFFGGCWHLSVPACRRCADHSGLRMFHSKNENAGVPENERHAGGSIRMKMLPLL